MAKIQVTGESTMGEILAAYPTARTVLFAKFHIGGCTSCDYKPEQTLAQVKAEHDVPASIDDMIAVVRDSGAIEQGLRIDAAGLQARLDAGEALRFLDARTPAEHGWTTLPDARLIDAESTFEVLDEWPKDTPIVVVSNNGDRSLQKAAHFACYGMRDVRSLDGGIKAWMAAGGAVQESDAARASRA